MDVNYVLVEIETAKSSRLKNMRYNNQQVEILRFSEVQITGRVQSMILGTILARIAGFTQKVKDSERYFLESLRGISHHILLDCTNHLNKKAAILFEEQYTVLI